MQRCLQKIKFRVTVEGNNPLYRVKALKRREEVIHLDDFKIVELYLSRDESAIPHTAQKYGAKLRQIANSILNNMASAEECENETYLEAWNSIPPNEPRTYLFAFLGRITRHLAIDECRKNTSQKRHALFCELTQEMEQCIPGKDDPEEALEASALSQAINTFLKTCTEAQRTVFVRRYWYFDTIPEICKRYGYSQSKVKTMLFRMRNGLRTYLEKEGYTI